MNLAILEMFMLVVALMMLAFVGRGKTVPLMTASRLEVKFEVGLRTRLDM